MSFEVSADAYGAFMGRFSGGWQSELTVESTFDSLDEWWAPYTAGIGPLGTYVSRLDDAARARLRERCARALGPVPFTVRASAWAVRGRVPLGS